MDGGKGMEGESSGASKRQKLSEERKEVPTVEEVYETDLPLMSNVEEVHVKHYVMKMEFDFLKRAMMGKVILVVEEVGREVDGNGKTVGSIILDACTLDVRRVRTAKVPEESEWMNWREEEVYGLFEMEEDCKEELSFSVDKWSLKIWGWGEKFPEAVLVEYVTLPETPSLHWRPMRGFSFEEDVGICCYTPAAPVNNRGLFPCQEPPSAMATWQCFIKVRKPYAALLSSDRRGRTVCDTNEWNEYRVQYFYCAQVLPMSTFSIIVSVFESGNIFEGEGIFGDGVVPIRWIFQSRVEETFGLESVNFTKLLLTECWKILGPLPFQRLDIVLMPNCFPTLGLANPSMIFLSPSLMTGIKPLLYPRIAHEIGHFWFGLSIGALDWTEEWLSEGFATFTEDIFYRNVIGNFNSSCEYLRDYGESLQQVNLRPVVRLITLQHELESTSSQEDLHYLQTNQVPGLSVVGTHFNQTASVPEKYVKNGLEPMKEFMQVHYLKGYFCLNILSNIVGEEKFLEFLRQYVLHFRGKLVTSEDFVDIFKKFCTNVENSVQRIDNITKEWLRESEIPEPYRSVNLTNAKAAVSEKFKELFPASMDSFKKIYDLSQQVIQQTHVTLDSVQLNSTEKIIFLEQLLLSLDRKLTTKELDILSHIIQPESENPEVLHRWCETIIRFRCKSKIEIVRQFLLNHPAMGIYLYGELMISEKRSFQVLARELFKLRMQVLDPPHLQSAAVKRWFKWLKVC